MTDEEMAQERARALALLLESEASRKLVVAGPGTGKTHAFRELFAQTESNLALTFLRGLVADLEDSLKDRADVYSFHGYSHLLLRRMAVAGITQDFDYYPALDDIFETDVALMGNPATQADLRALMMNLDEDRPELASLLQVGEYYDAVGYTDSVFRVLRHLRERPESVPSYDQIVVDEYQDFSYLETQLIEVLSGASPILVAGDDDQALYNFRHASAIYLRDLVKDDRYKNFELPYCSRCTAVLVEATQHVIKNAREMGLLAERIDKPYVCYRPDKKAESDEYPSIAHAACTVERNNAPYMERYMEMAIRKISKEDVAESHEGGYPTVLVIGPNPFSGRAYCHLNEKFQSVEFKRSDNLKVKAFDGYKRLMKDRSSRLGWRILLQVLEPDGWKEIARKALLDGGELIDLLHSDFLNNHLDVVEILVRLASEKDVGPDDLSRVAAATDLDLDALLLALGFDPVSPEDEMADETLVEQSEEPSILVTTLVGAKGLQAGHVFVVGMNEGHFPGNNEAPTDEEVCQLLVALTRARKSCTLVSTRRFSDQCLKPSLFTYWLSPYIVEFQVNKCFFA